MPAAFAAGLRSRPVVSLPSSSQADLAPSMPAFAHCYRGRQVKLQWLVPVMALSN